MSETLYVVCNGCGEAFAPPRTDPKTETEEFLQFLHDHAEQSVGCSLEGFSIRPESEAM